MDRDYDRLVKAFASRDWATVRRCVDARGESDNYYLCIAVMDGYLEMAKYLVAEGLDVRGGDDYCIRLVRRGDLALIQFLVDNGSDVDAQSGVCLRRHVESGDLAVVQFLVGRGATPALIDSRSIQDACSTKNAMAVLRYLVELGVIKPADCGNYVPAAAMAGRIDVINYFAELGWALDECRAEQYIRSACANPQDDVAVVTYFGRPRDLELCGQIAVVNGNLNVLKYIISLDDRIVRACGQTWGVGAVRGNRLHVLRHLVAAGVNISDIINECSHMDHTLSVYRLDIIKFLVEVGYNDPDILYEMTMVYACQPRRRMREYLNTINYLDALRVNECNYDYFYGRILYNFDHHIRVYGQVCENSLEFLEALAERDPRRPGMLPAGVCELLAFRGRIRARARERASRKLYFWWVPICFAMRRVSGRRLRGANYRTLRGLLASGP